MMKKKLGLVIALLILTLSGCSSNMEASDVHSVDDLEGKKIGVQIGTVGDTYASDYEGDEAGTVVERYSKGNDAITSLKNGKIDCVIIDEQPAKEFVKRNRELSILEEEFTLEEYAIVIAKGNDSLEEDVNKALAEIIADGTLDMIIDHYITDGEVEGLAYVSPDDLDYANGELVMATNAAFPPYEYYANNSIVGIDAEMARAIADKMNKELVIEDMEFDSIITAVQGGKADIGVAGMTITEDRLKNINFSDPYTTSKQVIIVRNGESGAVASIKDSFYQCFIEDNRYQYLVQGLWNTILISLIAVFIGVIIGFLVAIVRATHDKTGNLKLLNILCHVYLTIIRGTPAMIQLLIIFYVIFASTSNKVAVAALAFGINSGAYVAEILRGGIMALDQGQFEGARSLGLTHVQTMRYIILPQTFKNTLPALANEFIVLIKETAISGYIGLQDLTMAGNIIRSNTYQAFLPLITVAVVYLIIVMFLSAGVQKLEKNLKKNERQVYD